MSQDADDVYRGMLAEPSFGVAELCGDLGLSEEQVRAALDELARIGLLRTSREAPGRLRAVSPQVGLAYLVHRQEQEPARRQQELAERKAAISMAVAEYADLSPDAADAGFAAPGRP